MQCNMNLLRENKIIQVRSVIKKCTIPEYAYACHVITQFTLAFLILIKIQNYLLSVLRQKGYITFIHAFIQHTFYFW